MNKILLAAICAAILLASTGQVRAHELVDSMGKPVTTHTHVWRQQSYGSDYRQGHSVERPEGSITIWSPNTYRGYNAGSSVRFARPVPYTGKPRAGDSIPELKTRSRPTYGQRSKQD